MMRLRLVVPLLGLVSMSVLAAACSNDGTGEGGAGGAGGEAPSTAGGPAAGEPNAGGACATEGSGSVILTVEGLPDGVDADVTIDGPEQLHLTGTGSKPLGAGSYTVSAARVFDADPIVRTVYEASVSEDSFCLGDRTEERFTVEYKAIPSSNKLWMPTAEDAELAGFASADIAESVMTDPTVSIDAPGAGSLAFDKDGNLWAVGPTIGEDMLVRIPASELGESGTREPDIRIKVPEIECFPYFSHIAFDHNGNLWLSACGDEVHRLAADDLTSSGDKTSDVLLTEVTNNQGLAFDKAGNLWVAGGAALARFDAARLETSDTNPPDLALTISHALNDTVLSADELAFDKAGNLWGVSGATVFQLASSDLEGTGEQDVKANVAFDIDVLALPSTPAFDDGNGLWLSLASGQLGRFTPAQLSKSSPPGSPVAPKVLITSDGIGAGLPVALFPAPEGLPLYHSLPSE